jgi:hypothetical protein
MWSLGCQGTNSETGRDNESRPVLFLEGVASNEEGEDVE